MNEKRTSFITLLGLLLCAQSYAQDLPHLQAKLDTVAITGNIKVLKLTSSLGEELPIRALSPEKKTAVFYAPPTQSHEYDVTAIRILVSSESNLSNAGQLFIDLVLPDTVTHSPSKFRLLPAPISITNKEVRKAKNGVLSLDVSTYGLTIPRQGLFVLAEGVAEQGYKYLGDSLVSKGIGRARASMYARVAPLTNIKKSKLINVMDFICIRDVRTSVEPQTWDFNRKRSVWMRRLLSYPNCPSCTISNSGLELTVREL